jgi:hypothetical protein
VARGPPPLLVRPAMAARSTDTTMSRTEMPVAGFASLKPPPGPRKVLTRAAASQARAQLLKVGNRNPDCRRNLAKRDGFVPALRDRHHRGDGDEARRLQFHCSGAHGAGILHEACGLDFLVNVICHLGNWLCCNREERASTKQP